MSISKYNKSKKNIIMNTKKSIKKAKKSGPAKLYPMKWYSEINKTLKQRRKSDAKG